MQSVRSEAWGLEDGIVKDGSFAVDAGMGLRALSGEKTGFAYVEGMARDGLKTAAKAARSIAKQGAAGRSPVGQFAAARPLYPPVNPISMLDEMAKVHLLQRIDQVARQTESSSERGDCPRISKSRCHAGDGLRRHRGGRCSAAGSFGCVGDCGVKRTARAR